MTYISGLSNLPFSVPFAEIERPGEEKVEAGRNNQRALFVLVTCKAPVRYPRQVDIPCRSLEESFLLNILLGNISISMVVKSWE